MEIEAQAKRRLADEYDAAQQRGEIRSNGERSFSAPEKVSGAELISPKALHEARQLRDAEAADPGVIRRALDARLAQGKEPTKARGCNTDLLDNLRASAAVSGKTGGS